MSEVETKSSRGRSSGKDKKDKSDKSADNSPERPNKQGLFPIPNITKESLRGSVLPIGQNLAKEVILPDISKTGALPDVPKTSPDLTKIGSIEVPKVIGDNVAPTLHTKIIQGSPIASALPQIGVLDALPKVPILVQSDELPNKEASSNGNIRNAKNRDNNSHGFLPDPSKILPPLPAPTLPSLPTPPLPSLPAPSLPIPPLPVPPIIHPPNLLELVTDPAKMVKTFIVQPILSILEQLIKKGVDKFKEIFYFFANRPYLAMPLMVFLVSMLTPVFLFILFAFTTTAVTFVGFIIAESTVLAMGGMILVGFLVSIFSVILMFISTYGVTYIGLKTLKLID